MVFNAGFKPHRLLDVDVEVDLGGGGSQKYGTLCMNGLLVVGSSFDLKADVAVENDDCPNKGFAVLLLGGGGGTDDVPN